MMASNVSATVYMYVSLLDMHVVLHNIYMERYRDWDGSLNENKDEKLC